MIWVDDQLRGRGNYAADDLRPDHEYKFRVRASGYHDTTFTASIPADSSREFTIDLRRELGSIEVVSTPSGASVWMNGESKGATPLTIPDLPTGDPYSIRVSLASHDPQTRAVEVIADETTPASFDLTVTVHEVHITTSPQGATITIDGEVRDSPVQLTEGTHQIVVSLAGYETIEETVEVTSGTPLQYELQKLADGWLVVKGGDIAGGIYVDGALIVENVQFSGERRYPPGPHDVRVVLLNGREIKKTIEVSPDQITKYDYSDDTVLVRAKAGGQAGPGG